jgi:quercetin dioxygenase-like cupin family protein
MGEVGSRKLFENDRVCVWEIALRPGDTTPVHRHTRDYVLYVLQGAPAEVFDKDLNSLGTGEVRTGDTVFFRQDGDAVVSDIVTLPATHAFKNLSNDTYREILVEIK